MWNPYSKWVHSEALGAAVFTRIVQLYKILES